MRTWSLDIRHSLRAFLHDRLFVAVAILTFAVGIGSATAVFTVFSAAFVRPLPFPHADRLVYLEPRWTGGGSHQADVISAFDYLDLRTRSRSFDKLAALEGAGTEIVGQYVLKTPAGAAFLASGNVTWNFFEALGVKPLMGRTFQPADENTPLPQVVLLSEQTWRKRFAADPATVGRMVELDGMPLEVAGILPASFQFPPKAEIWIPFSAAYLRKIPRRVVRAVQPLGLLREGINISSAQAELDAISNELAAEYPGTNTGRGVRLIPLRTALAGGIRTPLAVLLASTVLLLLIASVNVANLQLARSVSRGREFAIRAALGAGQVRLARQLLTDTLLLAGAGAVAGLGFAAVALRVLSVAAPSGAVLLERATIDWRVLCGAAVLVLMAALAAGIVPAILASRVSLAAAMRDGSAASSSRTKVRKWLAAAEVALAIVLLVCAGLMMESFRRLNTVDHGFRDPGRISTMLLTFPPTTYPTVRSRVATQSEILRRVKELPGVEAAGLTYELPMRGVTFTGLFHFDGRAADDALTTDIHWVSPEALRALGVPLISGRTFREEEGDLTSRVIMVNQEFVRRYLRSRDPIGTRIVFLPGPGLMNEEIVGVVGNVQHRALDRAVSPTVYKSSLSMGWCYLVVRAARAGLPVSAEVARVISAVASDQPISAMPSLSVVIEESISGQRYRTRLIAVFGGIALALAAIGIYGVVAYSVSQRTKEIAVRMAIGAGRREVVGMVLREGAGLALAGIAVGMVLARAAAQAISTLLFQVSAGHAVAYLLTAMVLMLVVIAACLAPAWRASKLDPIKILKEV